MSKISGIISRDKKRVYNLQEKMIMGILAGGCCEVCKVDKDLRDSRGGHINPWAGGNDTNLENGYYICEDCNDNQHDTPYDEWIKSDKFKKYMNDRNLLNIYFKLIKELNDDK